MAKTNSGLLEFKDAQKVLIALDDATSEVKKAVVIDADGVETDIQGVQPTGKKEITSTAEVNVADYATAQVVDADLVAGNIKKDVDILGVVGSYQGVQPTGKKEITSTAEVDVANYATAQVVDADLIAGNIKKDVDILGVVGTYEAAAGDFSTAAVTINKGELGAAANCIIPWLSEEDNETSAFLTLDEPINSWTVKVPVGGNFITVYFSRAPQSVSGDIEAGSDTPILSQTFKSYVITGNCTISFS